MINIKKFLLSVWEVVEAMVVALVSIFIIYTFIAQPFLVQGASMEPNFSTGNYLIVDEVTYRFREPIRGEVIVFRNPNNEAEFYIKRIIALPGEQIEIEDGVVKIDGEILEETYLPPGASVDGNVSFDLKPNEYFVMGDNRLSSSDSRRWGPINSSDISGVVRLRFWPINRLQTF